jgi:hypothetical protein
MKSRKRHPTASAAAVRTSRHGSRGPTQTLLVVVPSHLNLPGGHLASQSRFLQLTQVASSSALKPLPTAHTSRFLQRFSNPLNSRSEKNKVVPPTELRHSAAPWRQAHRPPRCGSALPQPLKRQHEFHGTQVGLRRSQGVSSTQAR